MRWGESVRERERKRRMNEEKTLGPIHEDRCRDFPIFFFNSEPSAVSEWERERGRESHLKFKFGMQMTCIYPSSHFPFFFLTLSFLSPFLFTHIENTHTHNPLSFSMSLSSLPFYFLPPKPLHFYLLVSPFLQLFPHFDDQTDSQRTHLWSGVKNFYTKSIFPWILNISTEKERRSLPSSQSPPLPLSPFFPISSTSTLSLHFVGKEWK